MWGAEALKRDFETSIVTSSTLNLGAMNEFYGTSLGEEEITLRRLVTPPLLARLSGAAALRGAFFQRTVRSIADEYDMLISGYNLCDFGAPGIHRISDFSWDEELRTKHDPAPSGIRGIFHRHLWLRRAYLALGRRVQMSSSRNLFSGEDLILANSQWTAQILRDRYGAASEVLYEPVTGEFPDVPRERRSDDFACIGRISPEKRIERMIRMVGVVRSRGHNVRIRIIGPLDNSPYSKRIGSLALGHPEWVLLEGSRAGEDKLRILTDCRYGIHARKGEAFGIAVAEMVKAGCITFAPAEGGPAEILDHDSLLYRDEDDAVEKICAVLSRPALQASLLEHLWRQAEKFSAENFMRDFRAAVEKFLAKSSLSAGASMAACGPARSLQAPL
ncbi:MAG: glycosyltransferase family 4 protein [Candidatus Binatus sp.]